jgi:hypothetical protein
MDIGIQPVIQEPLIGRLGFVIVSNQLAIPFVHEPRAWMPDEKKFACWRARR